MDKPSGDVVILGAGFSKAVHESFPVLSELAERVLPLLDGKAAPSAQKLVDELERATRPWQQPPSAEDKLIHLDFPREPVDFEAWLSRIAVDQPHLTLAENYERRALFAQVATAIRHVLIDAAGTAFREGPPSSTWPYNLLRVLDVRRATVITMNYDTIVELVAPHALWPWASTPSPFVPGSANQLVAADLFGDLPPTVPPPTNTFRTHAPGPEIEIPRLPPETLHLIKLHGSLDWFAARGDPSGATLVRWESGADADDHPPGREPFLVPPDANKSSYFDNPLVRELWAQARMALERAASVTLIGYSLPTTDTTFGGLLADTIGAREVPVTVVDLEPGPVIKRLRALGISRTREHGGANAVEAWTASIVDEQARSTTRRLRDLAALPRADEAIWAAMVNVRPPHHLGHRSSRYVTSGTLVDGTFVLDLWPSTEPTVPETRALVDFLPPAGAATVVVDIGETRQPVVAHEVRKPRDDGYTGQLLLLPATTPADWQ